MVHISQNSFWLRDMRFMVSGDGHRYSIPIESTICIKILIKEVVGFFFTMVI